MVSVMRLTKPALVSSPLVLACDELHDLALDSFRVTATSDLAVLPRIPHFGLGEILTLPQNFGYVNEEFVLCFVINATRSHCIQS